MSHRPIRESRQRHNGKFIVDSPADNSASDGAAEADMLHWTMRNSAPHQAADLVYQANHQLRASLLAILPTNMTLSHMLVDQAAHPEYLAPLRAEAEAANCCRYHQHD